MSSQDLLNVVGVTATVTLGLLSIALGVFAIWLSRRFDERSGSALEAIRELAHETRALIDVAVSQQKDFSTRMLDSILARDPYGKALAASAQEGPSSVEEVVRKQLSDTEQRISEAIEDTIRKLPPQPDPRKLEQTITSIRRDLTRLTDAAAARVALRVELPEAITSVFEEWRDFPAHFLILFAVVREGVNSLDALRKVASRYGIPEPLAEGVHNLLQKGVLEGSLSDFRIPSATRDLIEAWIRSNETVLLDMLFRFRSVPTRDRDMAPDLDETGREVRRTFGRRLRI